MHMEGEIKEALPLSLVQSNLKTFKSLNLIISHAFVERPNYYKSFLLINITFYLKNTFLSFQFF